MAAGGQGGKPSKDDPDKQMLSALGYDCLDKIAEGYFGCIYKGVCNSIAEKKYEIGKGEASSFTPGTILTIEKTEHGTNYFRTESLAGKPCAIKVLSGKDSMSESVYSEKLSLYSLSHPNCVEVYDSIHDMDCNLYYIVTEYLNGKSLTEYLVINANKISQQEATDIILQLTTGLQYIHSQGIYHGDLHSGNIVYHFAPTTGQVWKYLDFGLSGQNDVTLRQTDISDLARIFQKIIQRSNFETKLKNAFQQITHKMTNSGYNDMDQLIRDINNAQ